MEEQVKIPNKKGLKLATVIHRPKAEGRYPAVILIHGFTGNKEELHIRQLGVDLANSGFVAIRFDASGYGESEGDTETEYRLSNNLSDVESIYEYLEKLFYVDPDRIGVFGQSLGGQLSVLFAANHPEIKAVVPAQPPYELETHYRIKGIWQEWKDQGYMEKETGGKKVRLPLEYLDDARQHNALDVVDQIKTPILFILGKEDVNVLPEETRALYEKANQPKELMEVEGMDHYYKNFPDKLALVNKKVIEFFKKNL